MQRRLGVGVALAIGLAGAAAFAVENPSAEGVAFFEKKIRPVLVDQCYKCHAADSKKIGSGLLLDSKAGWEKGGESGPAIIPGKAKESLLMEALRHESLEMPPDKKLPDAVIADFEKWIAMGAPDPRVAGAVAAKKEIDLEAGRKFWAFQPPQKTAPAKVKDAKWARTDVDRFLLAGLEAQGLKPVADADRRTLVRRLYFDLVGLPPTPQDVLAFVNDRSPQALENLVDRLLASPHFGERWGRHWLDVARYAESNGNADNTTFPHAWRYRDYVIAAFNDDKPFDRFIQEQVAGDLLPADSPAQRDSQLVATGFLALGSKPRAQNNPDFLMDVVAEQLDVTTSGFMALTVACARCHDHKFDPIPTKEYYSVAGIFTSTTTLYGAGGRGNAVYNAGLHVLAGSQELAEQRQAQEEKIAALKERRDEVVAQLKEMGAKITNPVADNKKNKKPNKKNQPAEPEEPVITPPKDASSEDEKQIAKLGERMKEMSAQLKQLQATLPSGGQAMGVRDASKPADTEICIRGETQKKGDVAPRGFVTVATIGQAPQIKPEASGRLELAQWIASPQNPLTARVIANRIFKHLFGRGIVPSVDNFGVLGEKPSHPELLDYLAVQFVEDGWSIKKAVRRLVLTRAYGLSSEHDAVSLEKDPDNVFHWRHTPHRLDAESLRDSILFVSNNLELTPPGTSPVAVTNGQDLRNNGRVEELTKGDSRYRSVYLPILRNRLPEILQLFDAADPSLVIGNRDNTTVPAQSLYLMNSPFIAAEARLFAERLMAAGNLAEPERLNLAFQLALSRDAKPEEQTRCGDLLRKARESYADSRNPEGIEVKAWSAFCQALLASAEFRYVE